MNLEQKPLLYAVNSLLTETVQGSSKLVKGIVSRDFATLSSFNWTDMKFLIGPDQVYF
jgi:hypothetical protein